MIFQLLSLLALVLASQAAELSAEVHAQFDAFKLKYKKAYETEEEEAARRVVFSESLTRIAAQNAESVQRGSSARFAVNQFADLSPAEFKAKYLTANIKQKHTPAQALALRDKHEAALPRAQKRALDRVVAATKHIDWRDHGLVTRVKNQAQCGSCWAFSATEEIESMLLKSKPGQFKNTTLALSPQQIVDCDGTSAGCGGGLTESAWDYVIQAGGIESNASYPYVANDQQCAFDASKVVTTIKSYTPATSWYSESQLLQTLVNEGPISVCVDAASWQSYSHGVMDRLQCAWVDVLDHCVQLVGYDATGPTPAWLWGVNGYIYLEYGWDVCGVANDANYVTI